MVDILNLVPWIIGATGIFFLGFGTLNGLVIPIIVGIVSTFLGGFLIYIFSLIDEESKTSDYKNDIKSASDLMRGKK